jgi:hypothetical protein
VDLGGEAGGEIDATLASRYRLFDMAFTAIWNLVLLGLAVAVVVATVWGFLIYQ